MKGDGSAFKTAAAAEVTSNCLCIRIVRGDGVAVGLTTATRDVPFGGTTYKAFPGINSTDVTTRAALNTDNLEIDSLLDSSTITDANTISGMWDFAPFQIFRIDYNNTSNGISIVREGWLGEIRSTGLNFVAELMGKMQRLQMNFGHAVLPGCAATLGDAFCQVNLLTFPDGTITAVPVTSVVSQSQFTASSLTQATNWFALGHVKFTSGQNAGLSEDIRSFTSGGAIRTFLPFPFPIAVSDQFTIVVGCDKLVETCNGKFNNIVNRQAFDHLPGIDEMVSGGVPAE